VEQYLINRKILKAKLRSLPKDQFDMHPILEDYEIEGPSDSITKNVKAHCDTVGCIAGHAHRLAGFGDIVYWDDEWERLFVDTNHMASVLGTYENDLLGLIQDFSINTIDDACHRIDDLPVVL